MKILFAIVLTIWTFLRMSWRREVIFLVLLFVGFAYAQTPPTPPQSPCDIQLGVVEANRKQLEQAIGTLVAENRTLQEKLKAKEQPNAK